MIYKERITGITEESKRYTKQHLQDIGLVTRIDCWEHDSKTVICGTKGTIIITGFNCGYAGEGPHGLLWLMEQVAPGRVTIEQISSTDHYIWRR